MLSISTIKHLRDERRISLGRTRTVALVPTMGYLHDGHLSLVRRARELADEVWVSIFVNPTQFGPTEDLDRYPRDLERDLELLKAERAKLVFAPSTEEMYPTEARVNIGFSGLETVLCGASRPDHFGGVGLVVGKLFNIVEPDVAVFGQKDAQQALLIRRLVNDLNFPVAIEIAPTVREADGLAMSSRNVNLNEAERRAAPTLRRALIAGRDAILAGAGRPDIVVDLMQRMIAAEPLLRLDYAECVSADDLTAPDTIEQPVLLAIAAFAGAVRLIDNEIVEGPQN